MMRRKTTYLLSFVGSIVLFYIITLTSNFLVITKTRTYIPEMHSPEAQLKSFSVDKGKKSIVIAKDSVNDSKKIDTSSPLTVVVIPEKKKQDNDKENVSNVAEKETENLPMIYFITPTHPRQEQLADMTRLANTLKHIKNLHWLVGEDSKNPNDKIKDLLTRSGISYTYQVAPRPAHLNPVHGRGVSGRKAGIQWIKDNNVTEGVMYFGDDDNAYDVRLFDEMRYTKKIAMWPVGLVTNLGISTPIVKDGKVTGFYDGWQGDRKFPLDMAGFAVGIPFLLKAKSIDLPFKQGYIETKFLESLGTQLSDIEVKAENCTKVYVWHTQTKRNDKPKPVNFDKFHGRGTNLETIAKLVA